MQPFSVDFNVYKVIMDKQEPGTPLRNVFVHLFINNSMILTFVSVKPYIMVIFCS